MNKSIILSAVLMLVAGFSFGQGKYFTRDGHISFYSETPVEDIEANNHKVTTVLDAETGAIEFAVLIKSFEFEKALMEEHFNENYMESNDFPKATFKGKINDFKGVRDSGFPPGVEMIAEGTLTIHGVSNEIKAIGHIDQEGENLHVTSGFIVKPEDYDIEIPNTVRENIAKEIKVKVDCVIEPLNK